MNYEIIVVGGGHAGCEAALACARKNHKTLLISGNLENIADMPCNPSVGGPAKGIVVREIDALGGEMAKNTDKSSLQMKMLNTKKGKAVQALRAQADKVLYKKEMQKTLKTQENLDLKEGFVEDLIVENSKVNGVVLADWTKITSLAVILTTGTYLRSSILIGSKKKSEGPHGEKESKFLSTKLKDLGFTIKRLKTGTPPRIERSSIDFSKVAIENGSSENLTFSYDNTDALAYHYQIPCHLVYTNSKTHKIIKDHLKESSMYGGYVEGVGPRYCPSIEDKVVRFQDKERHQLFLEPESLSYDDIYLQGFSTSMPEYVQEKMVHSLEGLENAKILRYAYAIEYDAIDSKQIKRSLETKLIEGLYTAGQINGTSGYEEAAGQGLMAGINASLKVEGKEPLILNRSESYIGVLIDDLVTKGVKDPYRLLTSRAEYRLLLRNDNADLRLREYGHQIGLVDDNRYQKFLLKKQHIGEIVSTLKEIKITPTKETNTLLENIGTSSIKDGITLYELLKRPELSFIDIEKFKEFPYSNAEKEEVEIMIQYEGYIKKQEKDTKKLLDLEKIKIPANISYDDIKNIASEAREKLKQVEPETLGQASRISGVNPADIAIIMVYLKKGERKNDWDWIYRASKKIRTFSYR